MNTTWKPHEIARHQQLKAGVLEGFGQGLNHGLLALDRGATVKARLTQAEGQRHDHQHQEAQGQQGLFPAQLGDQLPFHRHHQELPEGPGRSSHAHGPGALFGRDLPTQYAIDHGIRGAGLACADQDAGGQGNTERAARQRHAGQAQRVQQGAAQQHLESAQAVCGHAGKNAAQAPGQVLDGDRQGEGLTRPALVLGDGLQPQAKAMADAHRQGDDGRAADQQLGQR